MEHFRLKKFSKILLPLSQMSPAGRTSLLYASVALLWIFLSDHVVQLYFSGHGSSVWLQSLKGLFFVLVTALVLYVFIRRDERVREALADKLAREAERMAHIMAVNPAALYSLSQDPQRNSSAFEVDYVSPKSVQITGFSPAQWRAMPGLWLSRIHPHDRDKAALVQQQLLQGETLQHEYRFMHADGSYRWIYDQLVLARSPADERSVVVGAWLDVTDRKRTETELQDSEARYRMLFAANPMPLWVYDHETLAFLAVNAAAVEKYGYSQAEFLTMTIRDLRPPDEVSRLVDRGPVDFAAPDSVLTFGTWQHQTKSGQVFPVEVRSHEMEFNGRAAHMVLAHDISDRVRVQEQLQLTAQVFESSQEGIVITDAHNRFISVNRAFTNITGYTNEDVVGNNPSLLASGRQSKAFYQRMWRAVQLTGRWQGEVWNRRKNGEIYPEWLSISAIRNAQGQITQHIAILTDITIRKDTEETIRVLSNYDPLTHLPNRTLLRDRAQVALGAARRSQGQLALLYVDLDRFKNINDSLGHAVGDQLLQQLATRLSTNMHADDTICRPGGDEFILLLPNTDYHGAAHVAQRTLKIIAEPFVIDGQRLSLNGSIGIALFPVNGDDLARLSQCADSALFRAKQSGRGNFQFFEQQMHKLAFESLRVENDLRLALERHELLLYYQPQVDATTLKIVGVEALIRWQHPEWGLVSPARFIPVAEESGQIREIGNWVLKTAVQQNAAWQAAGLPIVPVAINLSVVQFKESSLCDTVVEALRSSGLSPAMVELELTESIAMEDSAFTIDMVARLHALGVALSLDDFGTGYSSLSYLKRFQIDKLKIDQSFVRDLHCDPDDEAIVTAIIGLARGLGFKTIAEGVETQAQLDFLRAHQCDEIQGYLISRPVPADEFARLLARELAPSCAMSASGG